jgi:DNA-binding CsgD family transcriptional regulator
MAATRNGWTELRAGRWAAARSAFESALREQETAEGLEGLGWAAWWLDDEELVFDARARAYRLYRRRGDAAGAARVATWLAADELDFHGATAVAAGWLRRARRLLEAAAPGPDHGWLAFHEGYLAHAAGDSPAACEAGTRAAALGRQFQIADLEMLGLALEGAALVAGARTSDGMRCLDEATATALEGEATIPISGAWTCCFLVSACAAVRDHERAAAWCERIAEFAARYGSRYMLAFCRSEYGAVHLARGRWDEAERLLATSLEDFARSRPAWAGGARVQLAELRRRQGRPAEALLLLGETGPSADALLCRARVALDAGEPLRALELAERSLRRQALDRALDRVPGLELVVRARVARGEHEAASVAAAELSATAGRVGTPALVAASALAAGLLAAGRGDHRSAQGLFEDATDGFEGCGTPFDAALARTELAVSLAALGRDDDARREATSARDVLAGLGAPAEAARADSVVRSLARPAEPRVTRREREVLGLLADGLTNRQIAARLVVSEHTVHRHVTNILRKLELPSRTAAAAHAVRTGLLDEQR